MIRTYGPVVLLIIVLALLWEYGVQWFDVPHYIIPTLSSVATALWENRGSLTHHFGVTLGEALIGLALSVVTGCALAIWMHMSKLAQRLVYPLLVASQTIPVIALSPILVMWFGYEMGSKIAIAVLFCFFPIAVGANDGFKAVNRDILELMQTMGGSKIAIFFKLYVPSALPSFFSGLKVAATFSVAGATIGEWLGAESGLGVFSKRASGMMRADSVFAAVILLSVMGILLFLFVKWLESVLVKPNKI
ncbi:ABC transporter permease [Cohnella sp. AR92]|uniref:ABC transporter permease n=1 Tax=Cohnella sp. AR92 TaxID=648716 RepID=UPI000F8F16E6|nr:ABC transporter permease [Cohnella sp. AR92]RUS45565.1 ABC transporter permease [Cohnella sp. AR92]